MLKQEDLLQPMIDAIEKQLEKAEQNVKNLSEQLNTYKNLRDEKSNSNRKA